MSTSNQTSNHNFTAIFEAASNEYKTLTGQDLGTHPFGVALEDNSSADAILDVFRKLAQSFDKCRKGDDKLMAWLTPMVHILITFSGTLGEGIGIPFSPAKTLFTGVGVLLGTARDVIASYDVLVQLFERIQFFLQRLNHYTAVPLTPEMTELLAKIMAQILSILALSTRAMKERRIKKFLKRLMGKTEAENALQRLDMLTKEENLMTNARTLEATHHVQRNQSREQLRTWLAPPNPSTNHNTACGTHHDGTAQWFIRGGTFDEWKKNGSLLWIRGNPGSGKSILCSAIIEDVKHMRESRLALVAYYYFDFKDVAKRDLRGLLASFLLQLTDYSDRCWDLLSQLYKRCQDGSEQPSEVALAQCLEDMLDLPGQLPTYIIIDALDECPNTTGTPSAREKVLNFVEDFVQSNHPKLFVCITSRPEQDIGTTLDPLTSQSRRVSLHEEVGQKEDIDNYVRSFILNDKAIRRWRTDDKELVISVLSERAQGMFRWVYCQLDNLRRCMPSSIRKSLDELPITLDETYERILEGIPKQKWQHAHRLFQCLVAAARPLRVKELAEIFAIEFGSNVALGLVEDWRPEDPEEAVLSACSTLISIIVDDKGSKIVQFSHFSVKEYLTSHRLQTTDIENVRQYYIPLEPAHTLLAQACLTVLLQLDENVDKERVERLALAFYAAKHWVDHAKFQNVESHIQDAMEDLFDPMKPHFRAWVWMHNIGPWSSLPKFDECPSLPQPDFTPLYGAATCGFSGLAKRLIIAHAEDVNGKCCSGYTPLHAASVKGHVDVAQVLLDHGADMKAQVFGDVAVLHFASFHGHPKVVQLLLEHEASVDPRDSANKTPLYDASQNGHLGIVRLLLDHGADANIRSILGTPFDAATRNEHHDIARLLKDHCAQLNRGVQKVQNE